MERMERLTIGKLIDVADCALGAVQVAGWSPEEVEELRALFLEIGRLQEVIVSQEAGALRREALAIENDPIPLSHWRLIAASVAR